MPPEGGRLYDMKVKISCACLRYYYESGATIDFIYATQLCLERACDWTNLKIVILKIILKIKYYMFYGLAVGARAAGVTYICTLYSLIKCVFRQTKQTSSTIILLLIVSFSTIK